MRVGFKAPRILDFDIESRPLGWYGGEWVHQEPTAIASAWIVDGEPTDMEVLMLTSPSSAKRMLKSFLDRYDQADMVTGHYIRGYDLPQLNGAMLEQGMPPLSQKMSHDTKLDLIKRAGLSSSQENLASIMGVEAPKIKMSMGDWRAANRLTPEGMELARERVEGDVIQHVHLRQALLKAKFLGPPKVWRPSGTASAAYTA